MRPIEDYKKELRAWQETKERQRKNGCLYGCDAAQKEINRLTSIIELMEKKED